MFYRQPSIETKVRSTCWKSSLWRRSYAAHRHCILHQRLCWGSVQVDSNFEGALAPGDDKGRRITMYWIWYSRHSMLHIIYYIVHTTLYMISVFLCYIILEHAILYHITLYDMIHYVILYTIIYYAILFFYILLYHIAYII